MLRRFISTPLRAAVVATTFLAALAGATSVALASIPDSHGVIHGCYQKSGTAHNLRVINNAVTAHCPRGYSGLNWSQAGPKGSPGRAGLSHGYSTESIDGHSLSESSNTTVVATSKLPAGSYIVNATVTFTAVSGENIVQCFITGASGNTSGGTVSSNNGITTIPLTAGVTLRSPATIAVQCAGSGGTTGENITAIAVNDLS
jgi:hypothetical protein